jgi:hypothetical protein
LILGEQRIPLSLRQLDLIEKQFEPIEFAADLSFEMRRGGRPSPVLKSTSRWRRSRRSGS